MKYDRHITGVVNVNQKQTALARKADCVRQPFNLIEKKLVASVEVSIHIAKVEGLSIEEIFFLKDLPPSPLQRISELFD